MSDWMCSTPFNRRLWTWRSCPINLGKELSFFGGISTQRTLPFGSPGQVKQEVMDCIETLGKNNGYIISSLP
ncbi:MAG: hypothetical protein U5N58_07120 [Actinomycetota bacterium]|nr:hypothetical protein [Actinomycetota bacterium]